MRPKDLQTNATSCSNSNRPDRVAQLAEHWASIPKVVGSNPTVARHIFQACPVWIYTQSNITQASYSPEYITPKQQISSLISSARTKLLTS